MKKNINIKKIITVNAPLPIGPYSQALIFGKFVFCSGQIGIDPKLNKMKKGIKGQVRQAILNLKSILEASGSSIENVLKVTIFLKNIKDFDKMNKIYNEFFSQNKPARSTIEVSNLPKNALIEIEAIAAKP